MFTFMNKNWYKMGVLLSKKENSMVHVSACSHLSWNTLCWRAVKILPNLCLWKHAQLKQTGGPLHSTVIQCAECCHSTVQYVWASEVILWQWKVKFCSHSNQGTVCFKPKGLCGIGVIYGVNSADMCTHLWVSLIFHHQAMSGHVSYCTLYCTGSVQYVYSALP